jgi:hypothetical protein
MTSCTGNCHQGRYFTCTVIAMPTPINRYTQAAEACTDVGFEDEYPMPLRDRLAVVGIYTASAAIVIGSILFAIY